MSDTRTEGVRTLLGDPKKAMIKLSIPMIIAMLVQTAYNLFDAIWVSGLGADALAAVGFVFPIFFMVLGLSAGLGVGAGSAISRRIGANDKEGADSVAVHSFVLLVIISIALTIPLFIFAPQIFEAIGAGRTTGLAVDYSRALFIGTIILFFSNVANNILRAEGDAKRAMWVLVIGSVLNIFLDPIFIYTFDMGIAGAAWATVLSFSVSAGMMLYWFLHKKDSYVSFRFKGFRFDRAIIKDILQVGLPASVQQFSMSLTAFIMNLIILMVSDTDGVAIYSTGWRVISIAIVPLIGIASSVTPLTGAAFGAKQYPKIRVTHEYAIRIGLVIEVLIAGSIYLFAPQITSVFTLSSDAARIGDGLIVFLQIASLFCPGVAWGMMSSSTFQGVGKGMNALAATILRTIVLTSLLAYLFGVVLGYGLEGIWWGLVLANLTGSLVVYTWARAFITRLIDGRCQKGAKDAVFE
jgi:putative MATE family efflux protein